MRFISFPVLSVLLVTGCASAPVVDAVPAPVHVRRATLRAAEASAPRRVSREALDILEARIRIHAQAIENIGRNARRGKLLPSGHALDVAIDGEGFFAVRLSDGSLGYTRDGQLQLSNKRELVTATGFSLYPPVVFPSAELASGEVKVSAEGVVKARRANGFRWEEVGRMRIARFEKPEYLELGDHNLLTETGASGAAALGTPGSDGFAALKQGYVEASSIAAWEEGILLREAMREYREVRGMLANGE